MAFAFVASGSGYCRLKMNNFMQLLLLLLFMGRGACVSPTGVRNFLQADIAGGGDENRRRKINWKAWAYDGLPDVVEDTDDDDDGDNPEIWLRRAKSYGYAYENQCFLRRAFFDKGSIEQQYIENSEPHHQVSAASVHPHNIPHTHLSCKQNLCKEMLALRATCFRRRRLLHEHKMPHIRTTHMLE